MKGHRDEKSVRIYLALAAAFSTSPIESNFFKGDLTHKERGPVDEKISTEKKKGIIMMRVYSQKVKKIRGDIIIVLYIPRAPGIRKSRVLFLSPNEREKVCVLKIGARFPLLLSLELIDRSERARANCERREYYLKGN